MAKDIPIGARGEAEETVEFKHTLTAHRAELPPVYSTPDMIRLMETAAFNTLQPYCDGDEITVGTAINIEHRAASQIGARVKAEAVLESFDGRFYTLRVTARDDKQGIGRGTVRRAVVSVGRFVEKMKDANGNAAGEIPVRLPLPSARGSLRAGSRPAGGSAGLRDDPQGKK